jgi:hypothetical protein
MWRERLPRLVGPSASHFHDGEGFYSACEAGESKVWFDDFYIVLQAMEIDGVPLATIFVEYVRTADREQPELGGGAL